MLTRRESVAALGAFVLSSCGGGGTAGSSATAALPTSSPPSPTPTPTPASGPLPPITPTVAGRSAFYVDAMSDWNTAGHGVPTGLANHPVTGQLDPVTGRVNAFALELIVTGAIGARQLVVQAGALGDAVGYWAAVIRHDDGSFGTYAVATVGANTITLKTPLIQAVTRGPLQNLHAGFNDQHYSPLGFQGLNEHIWRYPPWKAYRGDVIAANSEYETLTSKWMLNGLPAAGTGETKLNYAVELPDGNVSATVAVARNIQQHLVVPSGNGQSIEWTVPLNGASGYVDTYLAASGPQTMPAKVEIFINEVAAASFDVFGLQRIAHRFDKAQSGKIKITFPEGDAAGRFVWRIGKTTWWKLPADIPASLFFPGARLEYLGDSWGAYYGGIGPAVLGDHIVRIGGTFVNPSQGDRTSRWARDNFDALVLAQNPDILVLEFFTNDNNAGMFATGEWQQNMNWLIVECLKRNIRPIVLLPTSVAGLGQSQGHAEMASNLAEGAAP